MGEAQDLEHLGEVLLSGDHVLWYADKSTSTGPRWGNSVTARRNWEDGRRYAGFGYAIHADPSSPAGLRFNPHYIQFGKQSVLVPRRRAPGTAVPMGGSD